MLTQYKSVTVTISVFSFFFRLISKAIGFLKLGDNNQSLGRVHEMRQTAGKKFQKFKFLRVCFLHFLLGLPLNTLLEIALYNILIMC